MSRPAGSSGRLQQYVRGCRDIFWQVSDGEYMAGEDDNNPTHPERDKLDESEVYRGSSNSSDSSDQPNNPSDTVEAGKRSPYWFERISDAVKENRDRSIENQQVLYRLDYRTTWIARLIMGLLVTVIGGALLNLIF